MKLVKLSRTIWVLGMILWICHSTPIEAKEPTSESSLNFQQQDQPLVDVLKEMEEKYKVFFTYDASLLENVNVHFEFQVNESLEDAISRLLQETNFRYKSYGDKYMVIFRNTKKGKSGVRKIEKKIRQIKRIENNGNLLLQPKSEEPEIQLESIVSSIATIKRDDDLFSAAKKKFQTGSVIGKVIDGANSEPLAFASVYLEQTGGAPIGATTDLNGNFRIDKAPAGPQVLVISFTGFTEIRLDIDVPEGETLEIPDQVMQAGVILGEEVIVTGQYMGQRAALNQQANSNTIVNVVSREKIQELPDVNAAESISRLPGVTISRNGGEGSKVTVRGVSPRFNSVTVNGQQIPSTDGQDRSVDLSIISSDILQGIEVFKAITPDMDGDAIGGSINLVTRTAEPGFEGRIQLETGYHQIIEDIGTWKGSATFSNRFFKDRLGIVLGGSAHRADRSADRADASYEAQDQDSEGNRIVTVRSLFLDVIRETRDRYSGSLTADWKLGDGKIVFDHLYSQTIRDILDRGVKMTPDQSRYEVSLGIQEQRATLNSSQLRGNHPFPFMTVDWSISRSKTFRDRPISYGSSAEEVGAYAPFSFDTPVRLIPSFAQPSIDEIVGGNGVGWSENETADRDLTGQLDLKFPFNAGKLLNGFFKVGGKIREKERSNTNRSLRFIDDGLKYNNLFLANFPEYVRDDGVFKFSNFAGPNFRNYEFQGNFDYTIPFHIDPERVTAHYNFALMQDSLYEVNPNSLRFNYLARERITAGYAMAQINVGQKLMILPGVRYENTFNDYDGKDGFVSGNNRNIVLNDTTASISRGAWLPMLHLKYQATPDISLRLAATRTLTRPNFTRLAPFTFIDFLDKEPNVRYGSLELKIPTSWNYDAVFTYYSKIGLFSVAGFYKEISDVDIDFNNIDLSGTRQTNPTFGYLVTNPINLTDITRVYGVEFEVQTSLVYLPKPLDGITLSANLALVESETSFPFFYQELQVDPDTGFPTFVSVDTSRVGRLAGQAGVIFNGTLGYEKGGFSGRISVNYQTDKLRSISADPLFDVFTGDFVRWDATISQKFKRNWMVLLNLVNLNNALENSFNGSPDFPSLEVNYGFIAQLGLRYKFNIERK